MRGREKKRVDMNNLIDRAVIEGFLTNGELLHKMAKLPVTLKEDALQDS